MRRLLVFAALAAPLFAQTETDVRNAVKRSLPLLQSSASAFVEKRACFSCHHNALPILTLHMAQDRGLAVDSRVLRAVEDKTFNNLRSSNALDIAIQASTLDDPTPNESLLLVAAGAAGVAPDLTTAVYARRLMSWQRDGHWVTSDFRPPHSSSLFMNTATAIREIRLYAPAGPEVQACVDRTRRWLVETHPASTEDAAFRLLGMVWAGAPEAELESGRRDLLSLQKPAGGWPQLPDYPLDAYSTGESLYALRQSGVPVTDKAWRKGLRFLTSTQAADGTWRVHTRMISPASVSPTYFTTGFPYVKDEYLSYAGTSWAVMALLSALPEPPEKAPLPVNLPDTWIRTALFGTTRELAALLDKGLDPNRKTDLGTTLLMMAAPDPSKVQLLLVRGADAKVRAASGVDALTIAASYRGTTDSLQMLLDAGAPVKAPQGVRVRHSPLELSSMSGDLENVKLLLSHGADPGSGLAPAVTFGYSDIVQTLIAAGASVTVAESTGINLLHWAAITNRPEVIPLLAKAGAKINALDDNGFTPLMYAATIDFGDTAVLSALLKAGADPKIKNDDHRTALEQAHYLRHSRMEATLRKKP